MPTLTRDNKILKLLTTIDSRVKRIELQVFGNKHDDDDRWLYDPKIVTLIKRRQKEAKNGAAMTFDELKRQLKIPR